MRILRCFSDCFRAIIKTKHPYKLWMSNNLISCITKMCFCMHLCWINSVIYTNRDSIFEGVMLCFVVCLISLLRCFISPDTPAGAKNSWQVTPWEQQSVENVDGFQDKGLYTAHTLPPLQRNCFQELHLKLGLSEIRLYSKLKHYL